MQRILIPCLFALTASLPAQIHLYTGSKESYPQGNELSGFEMALSPNGSKLFDNLESVPTSGTPAQVVVAHGGIT